MTVKRILELLEDYKIKDNCPIVVRNSAPFLKSSSEHICLALKKRCEDFALLREPNPFALKETEVLKVILDPGYDCCSTIRVGQFKNYLSSLENKDLPLYANFPKEERCFKIINCLPAYDCKELISKETVSKFGYDVFVLLF